MVFISSQRRALQTLVAVAAEWETVQPLKVLVEQEAVAL
jgi:hypothetical protein